MFYIVMTMCGALWAGTEYSRHYIVFCKRTENVLSFKNRLAPLQYGDKIAPREVYSKFDFSRQLRFGGRYHPSNFNKVPKIACRFDFYTGERSATQERYHVDRPRRYMIQMQRIIRLLKQATARSACKAFLCVGIPANTAA